MIKDIIENWCNFYQRKGLKGVWFNLPNCPSSFLSVKCFKPLIFFSLGPGVCFRVLERVKEEVTVMGCVRHPMLRWGLRQGLQGMLCWLCHKAGIRWPACYVSLYAHSGIFHARKSSFFQLIPCNQQWPQSTFPQNWLKRRLFRSFPSDFQYKESDRQLGVPEADRLIPSLTVYIGKMLRGT